MLGAQSPAKLLTAALQNNSNALDPTKRCLERSGPLNPAAQIQQANRTSGLAPLGQQCEAPKAQQLGPVKGFQTT